MSTVGQIDSQRAGIGDLLLTMFGIGSDVSAHLAGSALTDGHN